MISYLDILSHRTQLSQSFTNPRRKSRIWSDYPCDSTVLNFGSGDVNAPNHKEISYIYKEVKACDSDPASGAHYRSVEEIEEKFGLVIAEHVFEHITPQSFVEGLAKRIHDLIIPGGRLVATLPNIYNFGNFFVDFDHKNLAPPVDLAAIFCCVGFKFEDFYRWSKQKHMAYHVGMNETEKFLETFLERNYGLQTDRYVTMVLRKNG